MAVFFCMVNSMKFAPGRVVTAWIAVSGLALAAAQRPSPAVTAMLARGDAALHRQDFDGAIVSYKTALVDLPGFAAGWNNLGSAYFGKADLADAAKAFETAAGIERNNADYAFGAGLALVRLNRCAQAAGYLKTARGAESRQRGADFLIGTCAFVDERWASAEEALQAAERSGFDSPELYYMETLAARKMGNSGGAERAFAELSSRFPDDPLRHELLGEAYDRDNKAASARAEIEAAVKERPGEPGLHAQLGFLLWKAHDLDAAQALFQQELAIDPASYSAAYYSGDIEEKRAHLEQSLQWYRRALKVRSDSTEAHLAVGRVLAEQGEYAAALPELLVTQPALRQDESAMYWIARTLQRLGRADEAKGYLQQVKTIQDGRRQALLDKVSR